MRRLLAIPSSWAIDEAKKFLQFDGPIGESRQEIGTECNRPELAYGSGQ